jgi:hypothetical protein
MGKGIAWFDIFKALSACPFFVKVMLRWKNSVEPQNDCSVLTHKPTTAGNLKENSLEKLFLLTRQAKTSYKPCKT